MNNEKNLIEKIKINDKKNLYQLYQITPHKEQINSILIFPLGNIISVSRDRSIQIYDSNFLLIQKISEAHKETIANLYIKNDNFFITCSKDKSIKFWKKENSNNFFSLNQTINNAHFDTIYNIISLSNGNLISCSDDCSVKLWEEIDNNKYQLLLTIQNNDFIRGILLIEEKNIFISSGDEGTKIYNCNNFNIINFIYAQCISWNSLKKINNDKFIVGGGYDCNIIIISLNENKIIKKIENRFICWSIHVIEEEGIILCGGSSFDIIMCDINNFQIYRVISDAHYDFIYGFNQLKNGLIISYSNNIIKIWLLK